MELINERKLRLQKIAQLQNEVAEIDLSIKQDDFLNDSILDRLKNVFGDNNETLIRGGDYESAICERGIAEITFPYKGEFISYTSYMDGAYYSKHIEIIRHKEMPSDDKPMQKLNRVSSDFEFQKLISLYKENRDSWKTRVFRKGEYLSFINEKILKPIENKILEAEKSKNLKEVENLNDRFGIIDF